MEHMVSVVHTLSFLCFLFSVYTADDGRNDDEFCRARKTTTVTNVAWRNQPPNTPLGWIALNWVEIWAAFLQSALSDESITICSSCSLSRLTEPQSYYSRFCSRRQHTYSPRCPSAKRK